MSTPHNNGATLSGVIEDAALHRQLARFARRDQRALASFAERHSHNRDLVFASPIAALSLARRRGSLAARTTAMVQITNGAPLSRIMATLDLPMWTRRLHPEALHAAFSEHLGARADDRIFGRLIAHTIPAPDDDARHWLNAVSAARLMGDAVFAAWAASRIRMSPVLATPQILRLVAAFAFVSASLASKRAPAPERAWSANCSAMFAMQETWRWVLRLTMDGMRDARCRDYPQTRCHSHDELDFVLLETVDDFIEEGRSLRHCVATYAEFAAYGRSIIYSVRQRETRLATVELREAVKDGRTSYTLHQVSTFGNKPAPPPLRSHIEAWLAAATHLGVLPRSADARIDPTAWRAALTPYWNTFGGEDVLTPAPTARAMMDLLSVLRLALDRTRTGLS